eukprot:TRINITY_DN46776_c0_g1_i1.p1 TRINITY_DN46776_c0_g1~~TRINITY_DN46776_c0_g1_i1.p1  ORF type:complete len:510 (+),score=147.75 TRINITY_DN46776_c0_g1_i1:92-1531(+)
MRGLGATLVAAAVVPAAAINPDYKHASPAAVERWHDLKFGLRIHWGLYASGILTGTPIGPESWPLNRAKNVSFLSAYWDQARTWNPKKYNPDQWIAMMKGAGMRFFDFTTKHHEGFSMYDTNAPLRECWDFSQSPPGIKECDTAFSSAEHFGVDITGELVAAARRGSIVPGLYFSHIDWYDPAMRIDQWNAVGKFRNNSYTPQQDPVSWKRFVLRHRAQIAEVLTKYGPILELSLDMNFPGKEPMGPNGSDMEDTVMLARELAPDTLFRQRGIDEYGDYSTPEESFPSQPLPGNWQVIYHGSNFMSYDPVASNYVNGSFIVWHLVDIVAKGGLMQIGYGPDGDGEFHPKAIEALQFTGGWMKVNSESIYDTRSHPFRWNDSATEAVRYTRTKDNATIYATYAADISGTWPAGDINLACVTPQGTSGQSVELLGWTGAVAWHPSPTPTAPVAITPPAAAKASALGPAYVFKLRGFAAIAC